MSTSGVGRSGGSAGRKSASKGKTGLEALNWVQCEGVGAVRELRYRRCVRQGKG